MRRTTLKIDDGVFRRLKRRAAEEGTTLQDVTNRLLRQALTTEDRRPFTLEIVGWEATPQPGVDLLDRDALFDLMDGR